MRKVRKKLRKKQRLPDLDISFLPRGIYIASFGPETITFAR